jgi:type I restriction enzyme M protein
MEKLVENIWAFTNYLRGNSSSSLEVMDIVFTSVFLFRHRPSLIDEINKVIVKQHTDEDLRTSFEANNDDFSFYGLEEVKILLQNELQKIDKSTDLSGVLSSLSVLNTLENTSKSWYFFIEAQSNVQFNGFGLRNISQLDYENLFSILLKMFFENTQGEIYPTPESLKMVQTALIAKSNSVFDPASGIGSNFEHYLSGSNDSEVKCYGIEKNARTWALCNLRFAYNNQVEIELSDSLSNSNSREKKFDNVITTPPFISRIPIELLEDKSYLKYGIPTNKNADFLWVQLALHNLKENGLALVTMAMRTAFGSTSKDIEIKSNLVKQNKVVGLISLPAGLFAGVGVKTVIWVLSNNESVSDKVLFFNADEPTMFERINRKTELKPETISLISSTFSKWTTEGVVSAPSHIAGVADFQEIESNNFDLSPERYLAVKELNNFDFTDTFALGELVQIPRRVLRSDNDTLKKVSSKDLFAEGTDLRIKNEDLDTSDNRQHQAHSGGVLVVSRQGNLKPSFLEKTEGELYEFKNVYGFQINENLVLKEYLILELRKDYIKHQLKKVSVGNTAIPFVRLNDLLQIRIKVPSQKSQQAEIVTIESELLTSSQLKQDQVEKELKEFKKQWIANLGSKKHNILQPLNDAAVQLEVLLDWIEIQDGIIDARKNYPFKKNESPLSNLKDLKYSLEKSIEYANNLQKEEDFGIGQKVNLFKYLSSHLSKKALPNNVEIIYENLNDGLINFNTPDGDVKSVAPLIEISTLGVEQIANNIVENAIKHGFIDSERNYQIKCSFTQETIAGNDENFLSISFANNGKPFPKGMGTRERYITQGEKAGEFGNTGEGGARVYEITKHFNGELDVFDKPESEFPVEIKLFFPLIFDYE